MSSWILLAGCPNSGGSGVPAESAQEAPDAPPAATRSAGPSGQMSSAVPTVVFLGDSLTAGYGLDEDLAFPNLLDRMLRERGWSLRVVNAGASGDTTAGGERRLDWLLRQEPAVLVLALGANDGLRGLPLEESEQSLRRIIERSQAAGAQVILAGMKIPPNYGPDYARSFEAMYPALADEFKVPLIDFLLAGVAGDPELNQADGIHPNAEGQRRVAENVLPSVLEALEQLGLEPGAR